jgi:serine protease Do
MNARALASVIAMVVVLSSLFFSGYTVGRSGAGSGAAQYLDRSASEKVLQGLEDPSKLFVAATNIARPAVVHVITTRLVEIDPFWQLFRRRPQYGRQQSTGSGAIIDKRGYILTNFHVVGMLEGNRVVAADDIKVHLSDGRTLKATAVQLDAATDLAVLKVEGKDLPTVPLGDSDAIQVGQWVLAIGNPFGLEQTVTSGIISATKRSGVGVSDFEDFIQTDAPINPGNSGGPLVDLQGRLVGINTAIFSRSGGYQGIGFAVPVNIARERLLNKIAKKER